MVPLIRKDSYATQVVKYLSHEIETGKLLPFSKLMGIRELSKQFGVSRNVILAAFEELEKKRLIQRIERKGIFVSEMASNPEMLEVLVLIFMCNPANDAFASQIMSLISSKGAAGKINFYTRIVTYDEGKFYSQEYQTRLLEAEVAKLSQTFHSDCAVVVGPRFRKCDVRIVLNLPFPTLFIGNFGEGDFPDLVYNRIGFKNDYVDCNLAYVKERDFKNIILLEPSHFIRLQYNEEAYRHLLDGAAEAGIRVRRIQIPDARHPDTEIRLAGLRKAADEACIEIPDSCLYIFNCVIDRPFFVKLLQKRGINFSRNSREVLVLSAEEMDVREKWVHYSMPSKEDLERFNDWLCKKLHELSNGQLHGYQEDSSIRQVII